MGRGASSASVTRERGGSLKESDILSRSDMLSQRSKYSQEVDDVMKASNTLQQDFNLDESAVNQFQTAVLKAKAQNTLGFYDSNGNLAMNEKYMDTAKINSAYDECVKQGYHPSRGKKSAMEAVSAHEYGHALTDAYAKKNGLGSMEAGANDIVSKARKETGHKGVVIMADKISRYATTNNKEAIAEAIADVYCNGKRAHKESQAIYNIIKTSLGG